MNVDTSAVMRVVIENFNMTAKEMERLWAMQDIYINLLETQLRQSEEQVGKESMRVKMFRCKVIRMKQERRKLPWSSLLMKYWKSLS